VILKNENARDEANKTLQYFIKKAFQQENSINYQGFDSLKAISFLTSEDKKLRIVSWTVPNNYFQYKYYGFIQSYDERNKMYKVFKLEDQTDLINRPERMTLRADKWYGAHYYKIISTKKNRRTTVYTLLGWKGVNNMRKEKVIEVVSLKSNAEPVFGYPIFETSNMENRKVSRPKRIVFVFSAQTSMLLDYGSNYLVKTKTKKRSNFFTKIKRGFIAQEELKKDKVKTKRSKVNMITFDRLIPLNKETEGIPEFQIPEINIIDAFVFENGKWVYYPDVDARNKEVIKTKPQKKVEYELFKNE
jgi:hypothetical protein